MNIKEADFQNYRGDAQDSSLASSSSSTGSSNKTSSDYVPKSTSSTDYAHNVLANLANYVKVLNLNTSNAVKDSSTKQANADYTNINFDSKAILSDYHTHSIQHIAPYFSFYSKHFDSLMNHMPTSLMLMNFLKNQDPALVQAKVKKLIEFDPLYNIGYFFDKINYLLFNGHLKGLYFRWSTSCDG